MDDPKVEILGVNLKQIWNEFETTWKLPCKLKRIYKIVC